MKFQRTNTVLTVGNEPDGREPFIQTERAVFENGAGFGRKALLTMLNAAFPYASGADESWIGMTAGRAMDAIWPTQFDHSGQTHIWIGEMPDGFHERFWVGR